MKTPEQMKDEWLARQRRAVTQLDPCSDEPELFTPIEVDTAQRERMMTGRVDEVGR